MINYNNIAVEKSENTDLGSFEPLEASSSQTKQTIEGIVVVYGILQQVGSVQRAQK